jgi:hypothetical protein
MFLQILISYTSLYKIFLCCEILLISKFPDVAEQAFKGGEILDPSTKQLSGAYIFSLVHFLGRIN